MKTSFWWDSIAFHTISSKQTDDLVKKNVQVMRNAGMHAEALLAKTLTRVPLAVLAVIALRGRLPHQQIPLLADDTVRVTE